MSKRTRIFLGILLIYTVGIAFVLYRVVSDIDPRYRESAEESLVETSQLLATLCELHRNPKRRSRPFTADEFHPYLRTRRRGTPQL